MAGLVLNSFGSDLATLAPALPKPMGSWVGTGICDLRASVLSQQRQLDSVVDRVAALLSSMHAEVLQDVRSAVACPDLEARLAEMRKLGELLDRRLEELRAEAEAVPEHARLMFAELRRVEEKMEGMAARSNTELPKLQEVVTESLMAVHDRVTSEVEGVVGELKMLEQRLSAAESDLALLSDEDVEASCREAVQQMATTLRHEFQKYVAPYFDQHASRISALEEHLRREHGDLVSALQLAAVANATQEGDRALQKDLAERAKDDLKQHEEDLSTLSRQMAEIKGTVSEEVRVMKAQLQRLEETSSLTSLEKRLNATRARLATLEEQEPRLGELEEVMRNWKPWARTESPERVLNALEEKLELVVGDLTRQLERQIGELCREEAPLSGREAKRELDRLQETQGQLQLQLQQQLADLREDKELRVSQAQRQADELRREMEVKIEKRHAAHETLLDELKHSMKQLTSQHQGVVKRQADDMKQLSANVEIRMVKEQSALQRMTLELRQDLERSAQEAVDLCGEVLRGEQQQLVREFRQELERRLSSVPVPLGCEGFNEELQDLREAVDELKASSGRGDGNEARWLKAVEEASVERRRCDAAVEICERLARRMEWHMGAEGAAGTGVPGEKNAYEGMVLQREGSYSLLESKGRYIFDDTSGWLTADGHRVCRLICKKIQEKALAFTDFHGLTKAVTMKIVDSEVMVQMQKKENHGALFVLPAQLNGVVYPSETEIVRHVDGYKHMDATAARAQLATHPAAAQFLLDNAANLEREGGINVAGELLLHVRGLELTNGHLRAEDPRIFEKELHRLRPVFMQHLQVKGLRPDCRGLASCQHLVGVTYVSSLQADERSAELFLTAQYLAALRAQRGRVFVSLGVEALRSLCRAVQMMRQDELDGLELRLLPEGDVELLRQALWSLRGGRPSPTKELFREDSSDESRISPIQESTESRISVLMRRVDLQGSELRSLREKNEELSEAVEKYDLRQKVSRSLAGLED